MQGICITAMKKVQISHVYACLSDCLSDRMCVCVYACMHEMKVNSGNKIQLQLGCVLVCLMHNVSTPYMHVSIYVVCIYAYTTADVTAV
jgi:hypothetical protein